MPMGRSGGVGKVIQLNDTSGTDMFQVKDSDGFPVFQITSEGEIKTRRGISRI